MKLPRSLPLEPPTRVAARTEQCSRQTQRPRRMPRGLWAQQPTGLQKAPSPGETDTDRLAGPQEAPAPRSASPNPTPTLLPASLTQIPKADILFPNRCRTHSHSGVLSTAETCEQTEPSQPGPGPAGQVAGASAQVLTALACRGTARPPCCLLVRTSAMNCMTLAPVPLRECRSRMLPPRTLATHVRDHTCHPGLLTRMVSTRLWTWSCSWEACVQNRTR